MTATRQTTEERSWSQRKAKRHKPRKEAPLNTPELRAEIVRLVYAGCTLTEIGGRADMPSTHTINDWKRADPVFATELEAAQIECARVIMEDAADMVREATEPVMDIDPDTGKPVAGVLESSLTRARIAEIMFDVAKSYAEKVAPRQFGQLVKLGNEGLDGPAIIQLISYAPQAIEAKGHLRITEGAATGESS